MPQSRKCSPSFAGSSKATSDPESASGVASNTSKERPHSRPRFPRAALRVLEEWLSVHCQCPYPTPNELDHLVANTGLKRSQITNWFANVRKRGKVPKEKSPCPLEYIEVPLIPHPPTDEMPLFHRWLNSWTEHEVAALPAILKAASQLNGNSCGSFLRRSTSFHVELCPSETSLSSMEIRSYAANVESVHSDEWKTGDDIVPTIVPVLRRRRRLTIKTESCSCSDKKESVDILRKFQCTFCPERFRTKYDWQRHEKSLHLPLEKWTCTPNGGVDVNPNTNDITCVFCGVADPTPAHISSHGYATCASRPVAERTFYRKDHLRQHLRLMHGSCPFVESMDSWKSITTLIHSRCGFCDARFASWPDRVEHLAEHFIDGYSVSQNWTGDWGFDEEVMGVLEKASLPESYRHRATSEQVDAPSFMMDDTYANSIDGQSFLFGTELSTDYPEIDFEDFVFPNAWDNSMPRPVDFSDYEYSQLKATTGLHMITLLSGL